ncbi:hypothetical protein F5Y18DRAFT_432319 [Xylariaceae sp. FL1019]|nr:hypothetical protein F5Y18DRAFT_432319 [Xylariaceae sp. FL1019]
MSPASYDIIDAIAGRSVLLVLLLLLRLTRLPRVMLGCPDEARHRSSELNTCLNSFPLSPCPSLLSIFFPYTLQTEESTLPLHPHRRISQPPFIYIATYRPSPPTAINVMPPRKKPATEPAKEPTEQALQSAKMTSTELTPTEKEALALAWQCMDPLPKVDYPKLAVLMNHKNPRSAQNLLARAQKKLTVDMANSKDHKVEADAINLMGNTGASKAKDSEIQDLLAKGRTRLAPMDSDNDDSDGVAALELKPKRKRRGASDAPAAKRTRAPKTTGKSAAASKAAVADAAVADAAASKVTFADADDDSDIYN